MKSTIHTAAVIVAGVFSCLTMATPVDQSDVEVREFRDGLDYDTWVARRVDEGKLFWAEDAAPPVTRDLESRGVTATIVNAACQGIVGDQPAFLEARDWWCEWVDDVEKAAVVYAQAYVMDTICSGGPCRLLMSITWRKKGTFQAGQFKIICHEIFDTLYRQCLGGGTGTVEMNDGDKNWEGTVTIDWLLGAEASKTCPSAPKPSSTCASHV